MRKNVVERSWKYCEARALHGWVLLTRRHLDKPMTSGQLPANIRKNDGTGLADAEVQVAAFEKSFRDDRA